MTMDTPGSHSHMTPGGPVRYGPKNILEFGRTGRRLQTALHLDPRIWKWRPSRHPNSTLTNCRPSLAAGTLEHRHVNLNSVLVRSLCRQTWLTWVFSVGIVGRYFTATGDRLQQVHLAVFHPGGPFSAGDRLLRDNPSTAVSSKN